MLLRCHCQVCLQYARKLLSRRVEWPADEFLAAWRAAVPEAIASRSRPGRVRRGVLEVFVSHSALVQEMGFHKREILAKLAASVPGEGITDIRCRVLADAGRSTSSNDRGT